MLKVVDIVYHCHTEYNRPQQVLARHQPTLGFIPFLKNRVHYTVIRHLNYEGTEIVEGVRYAFFKRRNAAWQIPFRTHRFINLLKPDIVMVHGFIFPLQVIALKLLLGKKSLLVLQHHADQPANSVRKIVQKFADKYIAAYMFTAAAIAKPWLRHKIIHDKNKIVETAGATTAVEKKDKNSCKRQLQFTGNNNFLWVGRLNGNKDPITILKAFEQHLPIDPAAKLYMIFQTEELLDPVKNLLRENDQLHKRVQLVGKVEPADMATWYNAADFFISGSHAEAAGYALLEALSVGCIPIVSCIPAYRKTLNNGEIGFMFQPGDVQGLAALLEQLVTIDTRCCAAEVETFFHKHLSNQKIADDIFDLFTQLDAKKR